MPPSPDSAADSATLLAEAAGHYAAGRLGEAAAAIARGEASAADTAGFWELKGAIALAAGAPSEAVAALRRAVALAPAELELNVSLATALLAAGDAAAAIGSLQAASDLARARHEASRVTAAPAAVRSDIDARLADLLWQLDRRDEAIAAFARVAHARPDDVDTLNRLGMALGWSGRSFEGLAVFLHVAALQPDAAMPVRDVAQLLAALGATAAARAWFSRVLALQPGEAVAEAALAAPTLSDAAPDDATQAVLLACHELALAPRDAAAHGGLARALLACGQRDAAIALFRRAIVLGARQQDPGQPELLGALATALAERGDHGAAEAALRRALQLAPQNAALHAQLGDALKQQWRAREAAACYRAALGLTPDQPHLLCNLADALLAEGPSDEAVALLRRARALDPTMLEAQAWLGMALGMAQRSEAALAALRPAIAARPDEANWHFSAAAAHLALGQFEAGWPEYAWRWRMPEQLLARRVPADPFQRPDPAGWAGRTVLLYAEQGFGDTLQFLRYARLAVARGARVLLEVPPALKALAAAIPGLAGVFAEGELLPPFDVAVPLLHLPWAFETRMDSIPATVPYLRADLTQAAAFRRRMQELPGLKVGLVWAGEPRPTMPGATLVDRRRSMTLAALAPLAGVPGVVFVSIQKGAAAAQAASPPAGMVLHDWTDELVDFSATAALMTALDLIISVDSAPVHLAGALGRPVWLLNRADADWRWLQERDDSPWYPTLRQFRQARPGDWDGVVAQVAAALRGRGALS